MHSVQLVLMSDKYYDRPWISLAKGKRWFCSEAEAISAGFDLPLKFHAAAFLKSSADLGPFGQHEHMEQSVPA
jgi:hypothetical protein